MKLEIKFHSELKLARIVSGSRTAVIASVARSLIESIYRSKIRRSRSLVKAIEKVKTFGNQIELITLAEMNRARDAHIERRERMRKSFVASQISV